MYVAIQTALTTGTMMISGYGVSHTVLIYDDMYDGYAVYHAILRPLVFSGRWLLVFCMLGPTVDTRSCVSPGVLPRWWPLNASIAQKRCTEITTQSSKRILRAPRRNHRHGWRFIGLKRTWDQKLSSELTRWHSAIIVLMLLTFMIIHLFQFRFARPSSQTETSSLLAPNASVARKCCSSPRSTSSPDGNTIAVGAERFHRARVWYQSNFNAQEASGFHDISFQNIMKCDIYIRKELYAMSCCQVTRPCSKGFFEA